MMTDAPVPSPGPFFDVLEAEADEVLLVSLLLDRGHDGRPYLRHGTAVVAPEACGRVAWGVWRSDQTRVLAPLCPHTAPSNFLYDGGDWLAGRAVLSVEDAASWLSSLPRAAAAQSPSEPMLPAVNGLPGFVARLRSPETVVRIFPGADSSASNYLASSVRPALGTILSANVRPERLIPMSMTLGGTDYIPATLCLLGLNVPTEGVPQAGGPPFGLFVGRLERKAWLCDLVGDGKEFQTLKVHIGWEPDRIDLIDLILDLEQFLGDELVNQLRIPLEDTNIADGVRTAGLCETTIPTLGRGVSSQITLSTREGALLDRIGPHYLIEQINIALTINGAPAPPISIGTDSPLPGLEERSARRRRVAEQAEELAVQGAETRLLVDREAAEERLRADLLRAKGELLVHDRFFGQDPTDWRLLDDVQVPVRVVTAKISNEVPQIASHVRARYRPKAPMHDRFWIWQGGGIVLGGSPTTFGQAPIRLGRVSAPSPSS